MNDKTPNTTENQTQTRSDIECNDLLASSKCKENQFYKRAIIEAASNNDLHDVNHYLECLSPTPAIYFNFEGGKFFRVLEIEEDGNDMVYITTSERGKSHCLKSDLYFS